MARQLKRWVTILGGLAIGALAVTPVGAAPVSPGGAPPVTQNDAWECVEVNGVIPLNVRGGPNVDSVVVSTLNPGTQFEADFSHRQTGGGYSWVPVRFPDGAGWTITVRLDPCVVTDAPPASPEPSLSAEPPDGEFVIEGVNQDGTLDRAEIALVARSVVLIANAQRGQIVATGTGTVTTPDGLIVTNAHVIEDADTIAIGILDNINDPPEYRYLGQVVSVNTEIDVALIAIRTDMDGRPVNPANLHLPYIPASLNADEVFRGDAVYIFGYPGIGDDYLVVTTGSIVSVENGDMFGARMPIWYRTDAEIAPGNSGGLVVNGNGQFVGIPTFVQTEEETGGRLGGIRPAEVALMAVQEGLATVSTTPPTDSIPVNLALKSVTITHGAQPEDEPGIEFHLAFNITDWQEQEAIVYARFYYDDLASAPVINSAAPPRYHDKQNAVLTSVVILPCCAETLYDDLPLFIPYSALGILQPGTTPLKVRIEVAAADESWQRTLSWEFIAYTRE
jgi:S1-C subfamily serine protease